MCRDMALDLVHEDNDPSKSSVGSAWVDTKTPVGQLGREMTKHQILRGRIRGRPKALFTEPLLSPKPVPLGVHDLCAATLFP
jgi:hypothetical protein